MLSVAGLVRWLAPIVVSTVVQAQAAARTSVTPYATVLLPRGARLAPMADGSLANAVRVTVGPHVTVTFTAVQPRRRALKVWLDSLVTTGNARADSIAQIEFARPAVVAGKHALELRQFCGDCESTSRYVDLPDATFVVEWTVDGEGREQWVQGHKVVAVLLRSLRWRARGNVRGLTRVAADKPSHH